MEIGAVDEMAVTWMGKGVSVAGPRAQEMRSTDGQQRNERMTPNFLLDE